MANLLGRLRNKYTEITLGAKERDLAQRSNLPFAEWSSDNITGSKTTRLIIGWADSLPESAKGVLDLAAGQGIESALLTSKGYRVTSYDASPDMVNRSYFGVKLANITSLRFSRNSYSGALIKDAWVLIPPTDRSRILTNVAKALTKNGSVLIISQAATTRAIIVPHDSGYPISIPLHHFQSKEDWLKKINQEIKDGGKVISVEFECSPEGLEKMARTSGLSCTANNYPADSSMARENRWIQTSGFVAILTKK